jgi:hypothetical protein
MNESKQIPTMNSYEEMSEFWDTNSLADYWDQTEPAKFEISPEARGRHLIAIELDILKRVQRLAHIRGVTLERLIKLLLEQSLHEFEAQVVA